MARKKLKKKELQELVAKLERDLMIVCTEPESVSATIIKADWRFKRQLEDAVMYGSFFKPEIYNQ